MTGARQQTLLQSITASGVGVHSGKTVEMRLLPAPVNTGIVLRRVDLNPPVEFTARADWVNDTQLCTALLFEGVRVATVEHLFSALSGLGVDNVVVELSAPEVPIMDGSAAPFVYLIQRAGIRQQDAPKRFIVIDEPIVVQEGDKWAKLLPYPEAPYPIKARFDFTIEFNHPVFRGRNNHFAFECNSQDYIREISRARTFGFLRDIEYLQSLGLTLGGSLDNAVVVDDYRVLNESGLRFDDEFVRHKLLDAIGDLYLLGAPICGWYQGYKSGHDLNNKLCRALLNQPQAWHYQSALSLEAALAS